MSPAQNRVSTNPAPAGEIRPISPLTGPAPFSPDQALELLMEGNLRFASGRSTHPDEYEQQLDGITKRQEPYASILCCSDSRVPPERIFDEGFGRLFIARVAGNVLTPELLASLEYASLHSTSRLIVVLGHECCGAVTSAVHAVEKGEHPESPNLKRLLEHLYPVVEEARQQCALTGDRLVEYCAEENARWNAGRVLGESAALRALAEKNALRVVPAMYSLADRKVTFLF